MPLVSVIVPMYNTQEFIAETLESILASNYTNIEVVVVDDGSTDNSCEVVEDYVSKYTNIVLYKQQNSGVSAARNLAVEKASGEYILPLDSDDLISTTYISLAVEVLRHHDRVKVVYCDAEYFGEKTGKWCLPTYSINKLAQKNMIFVSSMFRKRDFIECGGFDEKVPAREDWAFWISMLKNGGEVIKLPNTCFYYRVRTKSRRFTDRARKNDVVSYLNTKHANFFESQLGGPLRESRSWSKFLNKLTEIGSKTKTIVSDKYKSLEEDIKNIDSVFETSGVVLYDKRNKIKRIVIKGVDTVIKSYKKPHLFNRMMYGLFRASKAQRSYYYANKLNYLGIDTPEAIAYVENRLCGMLTTSYLVSKASDLEYTFADVIAGRVVPTHKLLEEFGRFTAKLHRNNILHKDYSGGNILFTQQDKIELELIDLNRMAFINIDFLKGCKNFERLGGLKDDYMRIVVKAYAATRGFSEDETFEVVKYFQDRYGK